MDRTRLVENCFFKRLSHTLFRVSHARNERFVIDPEKHFIRAEEAAAVYTAQNTAAVERINGFIKVLIIFDIRDILYGVDIHKAVCRERFVQHFSRFAARDGSRVIAKVRSGEKRIFFGIGKIVCKGSALRDFCRFAG